MKNSEMKKYTNALRDFPAYEDWIEEMITIGRTVVMVGNDVEKLHERIAKPMLYGKLREKTLTVWIAAVPVDMLVHNATRRRGAVPLDQVLDDDNSNGNENDESDVVYVHKANGEYWLMDASEVTATIPRIFSSNKYPVTLGALGEKVYTTMFDYPNIPLVSYTKNVGLGWYHNKDSDRNGITTLFYIDALRRNVWWETTTAMMHFDNAMYYGENKRRYHFMHAIAPVVDHDCPMVRCRNEWACDNQCVHDANRSVGRDTCVWTAYWNINESVYGFSKSKRSWTNCGSPDTIRIRTVGPLGSATGAAVCEISLNGLDGPSSGGTPSG